MANISNVDAPGGEDSAPIEVAVGTVFNANLDSQLDCTHVSISNLAGSQLAVARLPLEAVVQDLECEVRKKFVFAGRSFFYGDDGSRMNSTDVLKGPSALVVKFVANALGCDAVDHGHIDSWSNAEFCFPELQFEADGEVTRWCFFARNDAGVCLNVLRLGYKSGDRAFKKIGSNKVPTHQGVNEVEVPVDDRIKVRKGDCIGITQLEPSSIPSTCGKGTLALASRGVEELGGLMYMDGYGKRTYPVAADYA